MSNLGILYGLGVGPGDPELITVKAFRLIQESPVIAYPKKLKGSKSYAHRIVEVYINPEEKDMLGLVFPMTKDEAVLEREWTKSVELVYGKLQEGKDVAFVTEGDPLLYSTFIHMMKLMQEMHPDVEIRTVPGISSFNGSASRLGIALADGDDHVAIIPAT